MLEVEELAELLGSKDGVAPPALLGAVCSRIEALSGVKAPAAMQQRRVFMQDWLARHSEWTPPQQGFLLGRRSLLLRGLLLVGRIVLRRGLLLPILLLNVLM